MEISTLEAGRFIAPGVVTVLGAAFLGQMTGFWEGALPSSAEDLVKSTICLVPALIYYFTPLRDWANKPYHLQVTDNIRRQLIEIAGVTPRPEHTWRAIKPIFFYFVDNDPSLTIQSKRAFANGLVWTTIADMRAIAISFVIPSLVLHLMGYGGALVAALIFVALGVSSLGISHLATRMHQRISDEQMDTIRHLYTNEVKAKIRAIP